MTFDDVYIVSHFDEKLKKQELIEQEKRKIRRSKFDRLMTK